MTQPERKPALLGLALGALGVVFGDIGTSPLYTLQMAAGESDDPRNIMGVCSLIFWGLTVVVTVKYLTFIMRADNRGEGGILALLALVPAPVRRPFAGVGVVTLMVIAGAALLFGDGIITPAISVLSAVEGLKLAAPSFFTLPVVLTITVVILVGLFAIQSRGTGAIGRLFGPVMIVWFVTIAALGAAQIVRHPGILRAISPTYGVDYFVRNGLHGIPVLGIVVLCLTGGEALYADMGHFGARPIRIAWLTVAFPALVLDYFGQGALLVSDPLSRANPFFALVPLGAATYALVALSTAATVIASQALISGVFSLTQQAVHLGLFPRVTVKHTAQETEGQIYVPAINWGLAVACTVLVLAFRESARLASAYGIAVTGTMAITSVTYFVVTRRTWKWPLWKALPLLVLFLSFDIPFFAANLLKFIDGGYVPILVGAAFFAVMVIWKRGRSALGEYLAEKSPPADEFLAHLDESCECRVKGTAVFMASVPKGIPPVVVTHVERIHVLPERVVILTVVYEHVPVVAENERLEVTPMAKGFVRLVAHFGFMEMPDVPALLAAANAKRGSPEDLHHITYYLGRETFLATSKGRLGVVSETLFAFLARNSKSATSYIKIPPEQVVELGTQIDL